MKLRISGIFILILFITGCGSQYSKPVFVASNYPVKMIIEEIAGTSAEVYCPVKPGVSPHTFSPTPADIYKIESAKAFFYVSGTLDGWAANVKKTNKIELIKTLPDEYLMSYEEAHNHEGHSHEGGHADESGEKYKNADPHFWTDPLTVQSIITAIVDTMSKIDPDNAASYKAKGEIFREKLKVLHRRLESELQPVKGSPVFLFHPSLRYMLKRYGLAYLGSIEPSPGKEPSLKFVAQIVEKIKASGAKSIFTEPQLPEGPAKTISEAAEVNLYELDPIGGGKGRTNLSDLLLYNARTLAKALK